MEPDEAVRLLETNDARAVLVIPEGYSRSRATGDAAQVQVIVNGDNANTATTVIGYATSILRARLPASGPVDQRRTAHLVQPRVAEHAVFGPRPDRIHHDADGGHLDIAVSRREKESGTIEQVRMAPIGTFPFIAGKALPHFVIALASGAAVFFASMLLFGLPMRGNWFTLAFVLSIYLVGALATGLLVSTIAETQQVAFQIALLVSLLPTLMLSGFIFPIASMPHALQIITNAVPARYFLRALRAIVLKGTDLAQLLPEVRCARHLCRRRRWRWLPCACRGKGPERCSDSAH